jgi:aspartate kinase
VRGSKRSHWEGALAITSIRESKNEPIVRIASNDGFCSIYVSKYRMNKEVGFGRKLLQLLEEFELSYEHIPSGIDNLMIVLHENQLHQAIESDLLQRMKTELSVEEVTIKHDLALITVVAVGMHQNGDSIAKAANALAEVDINIEMINIHQSPSQIVLMFGVEANDEKRAVDALYNEFFAGVFS